MKMFVETSPLERAVSLGWLWRHESGTYMNSGRRRIVCVNAAIRAVVTFTTTCAG
jgi:hypothetical protein